MLLDLKDHPSKSCGEVNELLDQHIEHVAVRIAELRDLQLRLQALRAQCQDARSGADCGILKSLSGTSASSRRKVGRAAA